MMSYPFGVPDLSPCYENFAYMKIPFTIGQDQLPYNVPSASEDVDVFNMHDALQLITDELFKSPLWWILKILPTSYTFQNVQGKWVTRFG